MTSARRVGALNSKTRARLLDCAEQIMLEDGYPSVTYRALAKKAGVTSGLVQYYFPTLDDLFIGMLRQRADRNLARFLDALRLHPDQPLRAVWDFNRDETTAILMTEFLSLANRRKNIRDEVARVTQQTRQAQLTVLEPNWPEYDIDPEITVDVGIFILQAIPKMILLENAIKVGAAHAQVFKLMNRSIDRLEPLKSKQKARNAVKPRASRR